MQWFGMRLPAICIAMAFIPATWTSMILAFVIFRLLDIFKPWPISLAEKKVSGGIGIMLDDLIAGVLTHFVLHSSDRRQRLVVFKNYRK